MGSAGSKATGRSYNAAQAASNAAQHHLQGSVAVDAARAAQLQRPSLTFEEEEQMESKDQTLGSLLDKLGGSIHGTALNISPTKEELRKATTPLVADSSGRLPAEGLKQLLELQAHAAGGPLQAEQLLLKYKVDPQLVQRALARVCLPDIVEAQGPGGIKAFAEWPMWFERRS